MDRKFVKVDTKVDTKVVGQKTAGVTTGVLKSNRRPLVDNDEIISRIGKIISGIPGYTCRTIDTVHRSTCVGVFGSDQTRPVCAVAVEGGGRISVMGYAFAANTIVDNVIKPVMKEFGVSSYQPYTQRP